MNSDGESSDPGEPLPMQRVTSFGTAAYAYDPASKFMKKPIGRPDERLVVGIQPGSHDAFKVAKERTALCSELLDQISRSVQVFRPSESLYNLDKMVMYSGNDEMYDQGLSLDDEDNQAQFQAPVAASEQVEIDLVLSGGGLKGYFMAGAGNILIKELDKRKIRIARCAGASAGSWAGMFILLGFPTEAWIETYFANQIRPGSTLLEAYQEMWPHISKLIPHDAYKLLSGRLYISITEVSWSGGMVNRMVSEFTSNQDLFECCCASSTIPYMSYPSWFWHFRGKRVLDGGLTNNTPVFPDGERRQLVFRLYEVEYPWRQMLTPTDTCIETLVLRGAILMSRFLQGEPQDSITWLEKQEKKEDLPQKSNYLVRAALIPIVIGGYIVARGTGLNMFFRSVFNKGGGAVLVPFSQAGSLFGTSTIKYVGTVIFARIVDILRAFQFLL